MTRDQEEQFEQDRLGNVRRKLDRLRAAEGHVESTPESGIKEIGSADTGSALMLMSLPTHADALMVTEIWGYNSVGSGSNTFHLLEGEPDGTGGMSNTTRRTVDIEVNSSNTRRLDYSGEPFQKSIGVESEFQGQVSVGVISDHRESSEPDMEQ